MLPTDLAAEPWPKVSVVIPAMNEARNLPHVFERMPRGTYEVILVDGNSTDDTVAVAQREWPGIRVITQTRRGKGNALACGFAAATGDIIAAVDADGSADPGEIPAFVEALLKGYDFAKGTRSGDGGRQRRPHPPAPFRQPGPERDLQRLLPDALLRPLLRLERVLAAAPARAGPGHHVGGAARWPAVGRRLRDRGRSSTSGWPSPT